MSTTTTTEKPTNIEAAALASPVRNLESVSDESVTPVVSKAFSRPDLLTLNGLYSTTKTLFSTYVPASAASVIKGVSQTVFKTSSSLLIKALPASASSEWKGLETGELEGLDNLLVSYFTAGDDAVDIILNSTTERATEYYTTQKSALLTKVDSWVDSIFMLKNFLFEKAESVKPEINSKLDGAKAAVQAKLEDEKVAAIIDSAKPYLDLVKENVDPARDVISEMATNAKAQVDAKGYVGYAKESAGSIRVQGLEAFETCKTLGALEGVKEISGQVLSNVSNKLEEAKKRRQPDEPTAAVVVATEEVQPTQTTEEEFTSASEEDTN